MHVLPLALLLVASQSPGAEAAAAPATPAPAPSSAASGASGPPAASRPEPAGPDAGLPQVAIEKMGQGDRAFLERDYHDALFAYMDAAYLAPTSAAPRVKLGRAYLALRYPDRAVEQAEKALALDPANAEARKLLDEARGGGAQATAERAPQAPGGTAPTPPAPRVFPFAPEQAAPAAPVPAVARTTPSPPPRAAAPSPPAAASPAPAAAAPAPVPAAPAPQGPTAGQLYRQGIEHLQNREFDKAIAAFTGAVGLDPRLAVAYSARASARFALGAYREAAQDYQAALDRDGKLATPLYGLAECHRALGETKQAAEMYRRYAESRAPDVRDDLRATAAKRAQELR